MITIVNLLIEEIKIYHGGGEGDIKVGIHLMIKNLQYMRKELDNGYDLILHRKKK
jgi:hypothetical protein